LYTQEKNSEITEGFSKSRRPRIVKWINIKNDTKPKKQLSVEIRLKNIYKELSLSSEQILNNKLNLVNKNG